MKKIIICSIILLFALSFAVKGAEYRAEDITSGVAVIREKTKLYKSCLINSSVKFSKEDFDELFGEEEYKNIKFDFPENAPAILRCRETEIGNGDTLNKEMLSDIDIISTGTGHFVFSVRDADSGKSFDCSVSFYDEKPYTECFTEKAYTYRNVPVRHILKDDATEIQNFEILSVPKHGILRVLSRTRGEIEYTPEKNYVGTDSFTYRLVDIYGNRGGISTFEVEISKAKKNLFFVDMVRDHRQIECINAVISGVMDYSLSEDGLPVFDPDAPCGESDVKKVLSLGNERSDGDIYVMKENITFGELKRILYEIAKNEPQIISEKDIEKILPDGTDEQKTVTRLDLAIIFSKLSPYFDS